MENSELVELRNKFLIGIVVVLIILSLSFLFLKNKVMINNTVLERIGHKKSIVLVVVDNKDNHLTKLLKDMNVSYYLINRNTDEDYDEIVNRLDMSYDDIVPPTIIYVKKGKLEASLVEVKDDSEVREFVENYKLSK